MCRGAGFRGVFGCCFAIGIRGTGNAGGFALFGFLAFGGLMPLTFQPPHFLFALLKGLHGGGLLFAPAQLKARPSWMDGRHIEEQFTSAARAVDERNRHRRRRHPGPWDELH